MRLYLLRHGHATSPILDAQQHLSPSGINEVRRIARFFQDNAIHIGVIWHSTLTRACQTAEIIKNHLQLDVLHPREDLLPEDDPRQIRPEISNFADDLLIITHMPFISHLLEMLLAADGKPGSHRSFPTGGLAALHKNQQSFELDFFIHPENLPEA